MNEGNLQKKQKKIHVGKECAYLAVFVALVIAAQFCLSAVAGVEVVTVLFASYAFTFGKGRGMLAATAFSFLRMLVFGFFPHPASESITITARIKAIVLFVISIITFHLPEYR